MLVGFLFSFSRGSFSASNDEDHPCEAVAEAFTMYLHQLPVMDVRYLLTLSSGDDIFNASTSSKSAPDFFHLKNYAEAHVTS